MAAGLLFVLLLATVAEAQLCAVSNGGCGAGRCTEANGTRTCACTAGFQPNATTGNCEPCPAGTFTDQAGALQCAPHTVCNASAIAISNPTAQSKEKKKEEEGKKN